MTAAHRAVERGDLPRVRDLLDGGVDVEELDQGLTLLQHAVGGEIDAHVRTGEPLHVDTTAYLLARGADPCATGHIGGSALQMARLRGHWLAVALMEAHLRTAGPRRVAYEATWDCSRCTNGQVVFMVRDDDGALFAQCLECTTTYTDMPDGGDVVAGGFGYDVASSYATAATIREQGWGAWIRREVPAP